jgi:oligopeptide transport system substrate-binding protein
MRLLSTSASGLVLLVVALLAAGCGRRETAVSAGVRTHILHLGNQNEPATLDPHIMDAATDMNVAVALYEGLTSYDEKTGEGVPAVAERWDVSSDGLTYTFHLRPTAKWSNGDPVTAGDFAYSIQRILTPSLGSTYAYMLWPIRNAEEFNAGKVKNFAEVGVKVVDDHTLQLTLARPTPYLPMLAAHNTWMPVHRATVEKFGAADQRSSPWTRPGNLVGNGPFVLSEWQPNARISVTRNQHYWGNAQNQIEGVVFYPIEKAEVEELNFRAGQLHATFGLPASKISSYRQASDSRLRIDPVLGIEYINFNVTKPPVNDPRVRRALALAIDRQTLAQNVLAGGRVAAGTIVPPNCGAYTGPGGVTLDGEAARRLLAEAGFPGGKGFPTLALQVRNDETTTRMAEAIQGMWQREFGISVTIEPSEQKVWLQTQQTLSHTIGVLGWTADFPDAITFLDVFRTGNGNNWTGWGSRDYDKLLDDAAVTANAAARLALLQRAEALLLTDMPAAPIVFRARTYLLHPSVHNWTPAPLGIHRYQLLRLAN